MSMQMLCTLLLLPARNISVTFAQRMDPQLRKLLEVAYEAWMDTGTPHLSVTLPTLASLAKLQDRTIA